MISQLIETPSISCTQADLDMSNRPVIDLLANWMQDSGFSVRTQTVGNGKFNLIATLGTGNDGLVLSGHTDTVPFDDSRWQSDPFKLIRRDDNFYGLGSCDMKSFLAMAIAASQHFKPEQYRKPLTLVATADEETTMSGARLLAENGEKLGRFCVIGEPTDLKPVREHKGIIMEMIRLIGQSGHSSDPSLGNSALEGMLEIMHELVQFRDQLQQQYNNPSFEVSTPTMNLGHIHGGDNPNRICADCELHLDLRFLPGMDLQSLRRQIRQIAERITNRRGLGCEFEALFLGVPAMETAADSPINLYLEQLSETKSQAVAFGTEGPYFNQLGCETIVMGPGSIKQAHQPDEFLPGQQIQPTIDMLTQLIHKFCINT